MAKHKTIQIPTIWLLLAPYILIIASVIILIGTLGKSSIDAHQFCKRYDTQTSQYDDCVKVELHDDTNVLRVVAIVGLYLSAFAFLPLTAIWLWSYSKGVERITQEKLVFPIAMLILVAVPDGIDMLIIQDSFNKLSQKPQT